MAVLLVFTLVATRDVGAVSMSETVLVQGAVCSSLRGRWLFVRDAEGVARRLRFASRERCVSVRQRLKPLLKRARVRGASVFVTPSYDERGRVTDVGPPSILDPN